MTNTSTATAKRYKLTETMIEVLLGMPSTTALTRRALIARGLMDDLGRITADGRKVADEIAEEELAERYPIGSQVRNTNTGRKAWVVGVQHSPRDGARIVQVDYRDGSAPAASSAEYTVTEDEYVSDDFPVADGREPQERHARVCRKAGHATLD